MFKFLKDKLKGALSAFSKKVEETAEVVQPAVAPPAPAEAPAETPAEPAPETAPLAESPETAPPAVLEGPSGNEAATEARQKIAGEAIAGERWEAPSPEAAPEPDIPKIAIPEPEKKGLFSKIKGLFTKKEEVEQLEEHVEQKADIPMLPREPVEDVVVEQPEVVIEGAPLRKVDIHKHEETETPAVERLFEPVEPVQPRPEKPKVGEPEEFVPAKVAERIKGVKLREEKPSKPAATTHPSRVAPPAAPLPRAAPSKTIPAEPHAPEKKGFFQRLKEAVTHKRITEEQFEGLFWDLEVALLENNVAVEVIEKIKADLKQALVDKPIARGRIETTIAESLHTSIEDLFRVPGIDLLAKARSKKPFVICFVGINGSGKTTTIAKVTHLLQTHGLSVVLAAADTFRAAAIDQLQQHADKLGVKLIKHDYGSDPAAVAFDAIKHAQAANKDVVLIDTAGRLHSNVNLIDEMKKIVRVAKPDLTLFIGESITGNDCVEQAKQFNEAVGIDGIVLSKADIDEKGGAAISVSYVTKKPILYLGVGQQYDDLKKFDARQLVESLGL